MCLVTTEFERSSKDGTGLPISSKEALLLAHPMAGVRELIICINMEGVWEKINILILLRKYILYQTAVSHN